MQQRRETGSACTLCQVTQIYSYMQVDSKTEGLKCLLFAPDLSDEKAFLRDVEPHTLNPQPYTLHPTPYTPNPTP